MKYKHVIIMIIMVVTLSGCSKNNNEIQTENHSDTFTKLDVTIEEDAEDMDIEGGNTKDNNEIPPESEENFRNPDDFRIDTEQKTPEEQMKDVLNNNKDYIENAGLSVNELINSEWEYRESEDLYSIIAYDGANFHAVIVSVANNTVEIDPE